MSTCSPSKRGRLLSEEAAALAESETHQRAKLRCSKAIIEQTGEEGRGTPAELLHEGLGQRFSSLLYRKDARWGPHGLNAWPKVTEL